LAQNEAVQKEIEITDQQAADIQELAEESRQRSVGDRAGFRSISDDERQKLSAETRDTGEKQSQEANAKLAKILSPFQTKRLKQISIQVRGVSALRDPGVATAIGLTEAQKKNIETVSNEYNDSMRSQVRELFQGGNRDDVRERIEAMRIRADEEVLAVLTAEQKTEFEELKGEPFEMPEDGQVPLAEAEPIVSAPVERGFVIVDGRYIRPPYVIKQHGSDVFVNDHRVLPERPPGPFGGPRPGPGWRGRPGRWGAWRGQIPSPLFSRLQRQLQDDVLVIVTEDAAPHFFDCADAIIVLDTLLSNASRERKTRSLVDGRVGGRLSPTQWATIVKGFQKTPDLVDKVGRLNAEFARLEEEASAARMRNAILDSAPMKYGVTVVAMVLVVIALGSLLKHRPSGKGRWTQIDQDGDGVPMVVRNVLLLALMCGFDLALTLVARQAGGFLELNPLGKELASSPVYLASFKITTLLASCLILLALRRYRGAQLASWWLCLLCAILTFRWVTYNSLFLT